jgi:hypothetical protein
MVPVVGSSLPIENSPPGIQTIPFGIECGAGFFSITVGAKGEAPAKAGAIAAVAAIIAIAITAVVVTAVAFTALASAAFAIMSLPS